MRIDGQGAASNTAINSVPDILSRLKPDDVLRAQVIENSGGELTLKLSDGTTVNATALVPIDAQQGEFVNFVFKGIIDGKINLERLVQNTIQPQVNSEAESLKNILAALKLPVTDLNISLASALKAQNLQVNAETMSKALSLINSTTDLKPSAAAFLTSSNISGDANNIEKLQNLLAGRLKITNDISELVKFSKNISSQQSAVEPSDVSNLLLKLSSELNIRGSEPANIATSMGKEPVTVLSSGQNAPVEVALENTTGNIINKTSNPENDSAAPDRNASLQANITTGSDKNIPSVEINRANSSVPTSLNNQEDNIILTGSQPDSAELSPKTADNKDIVAQISSIFKGDAPLSKADIPLLNLISTRAEAMINKGDLPAEQQIAVKQIANEISDIILKLDNGNKTNFKPLKTQETETPQRPDDIKQFEEAVNNLKNLTVKIDQKSDEINPVKLYKEMDEALQSIRSAAHQLPVSLRETALNIVNNLENNMNFISQLNNYSSYVQIPLSIFNQNTTGELYMLKRGSKSRKLDPSSLTVLISLDSNHIGRIDTLLNIDKKNIAVNFRLENSDVFKVLKDNHKMLYNSLLEKGYRLVDFTYRLIDEPISIVNFETEAKKQFVKSPNNIDITV